MSPRRTYLRPDTEKARSRLPATQQNQQQSVRKGERTVSVDRDRDNTHARTPARTNTHTSSGFNAAAGIDVRFSSRLRRSNEARPHRTRGVRLREPDQNLNRTRKSKQFAIGAAPLGSGHACFQRIAGTPLTHSVRQAVENGGDRPTGHSTGHPTTIRQRQRWLCCVYSTPM